MAMTEMTAMAAMIAEVAGIPVADGDHETGIAAELCLQLGKCPFHRISGGGSSDEGRRSKGNGSHSDIHDAFHHAWRKTWEAGTPAEGGVHAGLHAERHTPLAYQANP